MNSTESNLSGTPASDMGAPSGTNKVVPFPNGAITKQRKSRLHSSPPTSRKDPRHSRISSIGEDASRRYLRFVIAGNSQLDGEHGSVSKSKVEITYIVDWMLPPGILIDEMVTRGSNKPKDAGISGCEQKFSGRIIEVEGDNIIIGFEIDEETEERVFSRKELGVPDDLIEVGALVRSTTRIEFTKEWTEVPTGDQKAAIRVRRKELEEKWSKVDPSQIPIVSGVEL